MGQEQHVLPPPTGTPLVSPAPSPAPPMKPTAPSIAPASTPQVVTEQPPPLPLRLGVQDRGQGATVSATTTRREKPLVEVVHQRRSHGWFKVVVTWLVLAAIVIAGVQLYPRVKEQLTLDSARVTAASDGYLVQDGVVSFRIPGRPHKILVHPAGESKGITGFRMTTDSGTLDVDVKNTSSARTPTALQRFCDGQFEHQTATLGPAIGDQSSFDNGIYRRTASWHKGEKFVMATCFGHSHSNVYIEATSVHARWAPYAQAVETTDFAA
jgi:hypothetical protein